MPHAMRLFGIDDKVYCMKHEWGNDYDWTFNEFAKLFQGAPMATITPGYPTIQESINAIGIVISKGRARQFDEEFRHALWVAPGYPLSMIKSGSVDPDLPQAKSNVPESQKAGSAHDQLNVDDSDDDMFPKGKTFDNADIDDVIEALDSRVKTVESRSQASPNVKEIGIGSWLAILQLLWKLGSLAF